MEGNYRIVQLSSIEFIIEKEIISGMKYPWYRFKKNDYQSSWHQVDIKGRIPNYLNVLGERLGVYCTSDLKVAQHRLEQIKKYPLIIEDATL